MQAQIRVRRRRIRFYTNSVDYFLPFVDQTTPPTWVDLFTVDERFKFGMTSFLRVRLGWNMTSGLVNSQKVTRSGH